MTDAEKRDQAVSHLKKTTVGYVNKHWKVPPQGSEWDQALDILAEIGTPPATGNVLYHHNYKGAQAVAPNYAWDWGFLQEGNAQGLVVSDGLAPGMPSMRATLPAASSNNHVEGVKKWALKLGERLFFGLQFKLPMDWKSPSPDGWGAAIAQLYYQSCVNHTWGLFLHADHCRFVLLSGKQTLSTPVGWNSSVVREYNNGDGAAQGPSPRAIPVGRLLLGKRHTLIAEIVPSYDPDGMTRIWHKVEGDADFVETVDVSGMPTLQYGQCYAGNIVTKGAQGYNLSHKFGFYTGSANYTRTYDGGNYVITDSFDAVKALMV